MLSTRFCGTKEIIILNHTECELLTAPDATLVNKLEDQGIDIDSVQLNPALPELTLQNQKQTFEKWIGTFNNVDDMCQQQVELLKKSPLIPDDIVIHGYIWQVESMSLRRPHEKIHDKVDTKQRD
jgi:carbonic anhydrase